MTTCGRGADARMIRALALAGVAAFLPALAAAQAQDTARTDTAVYRIDEVRARAIRLVTTVGGARALEVSLDSMSLPAAPTVENVLRRLPSMHVRTNSRGQAELSVRGSESRQVAVLVDGVPLTLGWDARTDVSVLPATAPQEISLVRGLSSILHGPNVLGGVVEMSVGQGTVFPPAASVHATAGVNGVGGWATSSAVNVPVKGGSGDWLIRAGAGFRDSPGAPLARGVTEPVSVSDELRLNTDVRNVDGFVAARYREAGGGWFAFSSSGFRAERGIAAELGAAEPRLWRYPHISRLIAVASGGTGDRATPFGRGDLEASIGVDVGRTEIRTFASRAYDDVVGYEDGDDRTVTLRLLGDHTLGSRADLRAAFTYADIHHEADVDGDRGTYRQRLLSIGGESIMRLIEASDGPVNSLRLSAGAAFDAGDTPESGGLPAVDAITDWGARLGASATLNGGATLVHAGISRRGRFPALREVYSEALDRFEPNPALRPEFLVAFETGVTHRFSATEIDVVGFHHRLSDAIRRITLPSGRRQRVNADQIRSTGVELLLSQSLGPVYLGGGLTLQSVELIDPGTSVSSEPENVPEVSGSVRAQLPLVAGIAAGAEVRYTGRQFCQDPDTGEDTRLDAGAHFNADVSRVWSIPPSGFGFLSRIETRVSADNIGDTALYDQCGLPQPGRLLRFQLRLF